MTSHAALVAEPGNGFSENPARARLLTPAELAEWLHVERSWIYEHAAELGAMRLGTGPRARLRFDLDEVRRSISCSVGRESAAADAACEGAKPRRRRPRMGTKVELLPIRGGIELENGDAGHLPSRAENARRGGVQP